MRVCGGAWLLLPTRDLGSNTKEVQLLVGEEAAADRAVWVSGSSNATARDERVSGLREEGVRTQLGSCVTLRAA